MAGRSAPHALGFPRAFDWIRRCHVAGSSLARGNGRGTRLGSHLRDPNWKRALGHRLYFLPAPPRARPSVGGSHHPDVCRRLSAGPDQCGTGRMGFGFMAHTVRQVPGRPRIPRHRRVAGRVPHIRLVDATLCPLTRFNLRLRQSCRRRRSRLADHGRTGHPANTGRRSGHPGRGRHDHRPASTEGSSSIALGFATLHAMSDSHGGKSASLELSCLFKVRYKFPPFPLSVSSFPRSLCEDPPPRWEQTNLAER